jgi:hypothetical protein
MSLPVYPPVYPSDRALKIALNAFSAAHVNMMTRVLAKLPNPKGLEYDFTRLNHRQLSPENGIIELAWNLSAGEIGIARIVAINSPDPTKPRSGDKLEIENYTDTRVSLPSWGGDNDIAVVGESTTLLPSAWKVRGFTLPESEAKLFERLSQSIKDGSLSLTPSLWRRWASGVLLAATA